MHAIEWVLLKYLLGQGADISLCVYNGKTVVDFLFRNQANTLGLEQNSGIKQKE